MNVTIFYDALDPVGNRDTTENVTDLCAFLATKFDSFPEHAKIYLNHVAEACEVTPQSDADIQRLHQMDGHFFVVVYPGGPIVIGIIIAIVLAAASIALTFLYRPNTAKQQNQGSPNNALANRENQARPNERIPDIVGTVRAVPDLLSPPYRFFTANQEIEDCFMCVGRKSFDFHKTTHDATNTPLATPLWDVKDDLTPLQEEAGASFEVWAPYTSPNVFNGGTQIYTPQLRIGAPINSPAYIVNASASVVGQILRPPNDQNISSNYSATADGKIECGDSTIDLTQYFAAGDSIYWDNTVAHDPGSSSTASLAGTYRILAIDTSAITLDNPNAVNSGWNVLTSWTGQQSTATSSTIYSSGTKWVGPFVVNVAKVTEIWCNFVAPQGLFKVSSSSGNQYRIDATVQIGIQAVDGYQQPIGAEVFYTGVCTGSATQQSQRAITVKCVLPAMGPCQVRAVRTNATDNTWQGTNSDQIQWRDLYAVTVPSEDNYGNVTCVQTRTVATASALTAKSRKLNMLVTAKVPLYNPLTTQFSMTASMPYSLVPQGNSFNIVVTFANATSGVPTGVVTARLVPNGPGNQPDGSIVQFTSVVPGSTSLSIADPGVHGGGELAVSYSGDSVYPAITIRLTYNVAVAGAASAYPVSVTSKGTYPAGASDNAADIIAAIAFDPYLGNRSANEVDLVSIYTALKPGGVIASYFGTDLATQFGYTFDDANTSFEEMLSDIQQATFCTLFRRGSTLQCTPELLATTGTVLFNHRNKLPGKETRTTTFGWTNNYDGIELTYIDRNAPNYPGTDTPVTLYFPPTQSALNPKKVTAVGICNNVQASFLGWRLYNKLRFQTDQVEFTAVKSAALCVLNERILVTDNTRDDVMDGYITAINGLTLTLSQPVTLQSGTTYTIFLQDPAATIDAISITQPTGLAANQVLLKNAPASPLSTDLNNWAQTAYMIAAPTPISPGDVIPLSPNIFDYTGLTSNQSVSSTTGNFVAAPGYTASGYMNCTNGKSFTSNGKFGFASGFGGGVGVAFYTGSAYAPTFIGGYPLNGDPLSDDTIAATVHPIPSQFQNATLMRVYFHDSTQPVPYSQLMVVISTTSYDPVIPATYMPFGYLLDNKAQIPAAMMLTEKTTAEKQQYTIKAVNYDARYYGNDKDFINGVLIANTTLIAGGAGYAAPPPVTNPNPDPGDPYNPPSNPDPGPERGYNPN